MANGSSRQSGRRGGVKKPAAVSGPGKLSRRTDGQAPTVEDVKGMVSGSYDEEKQLIEQVRQDPTVQDNTGVVEGEIVDDENVVINPVDEVDLYGQTRYPDMPIDTIGDAGNQILEPDYLMLIRAMAEINPTPELLSLLNSVGSVWQSSSEIE